MAYYLTPYLERIRWKNGTAAYCRRCDASVPLRADTETNMLVCSEGHQQHPGNVVIQGRA